MLAKEVSRTLDELAAVIAKLKFVAAELQKAQRLETKRQHEQAPPEETR
jgi:hypothetical protein